jgi:transcriptional regulator with XRE-family HTH domain
VAPRRVDQGEQTVTTRRREQGALARRLSLLRWRARLTRPRLAAKAGVSIDLVSSLEQGRASNPTLQTLLGLARALGVTVGELVEGIGADAAAGARGGVRDDVRDGNGEDTRPDPAAPGAGDHPAVEPTR